MKWKYWAVTIDAKDLAKALDEAGEQGWELVTGEWRGLATDMVYFAVFKRPNVAANISPDLAALGFRQDWREMWARRNPFEQIITPDPNGPQPI